MIPNDINRRILELYSGKRNRNIYPNPSSFGVNFAPTIHPHCGEKEVQDPICKGQIYYTFVWEPQREDTIFWQTQYYGTFAEGSTSDYPILNFLSLIDEDILTLNYKNYMVGWRIYELVPNEFTFTVELGDYRIITSYDPSTNTVTLNRPFDGTLIINNLDYGFAIFSILPQTWSIYIPTVDVNRMVVNKTPLYYNGYYVVFETPNSSYSNSSNSNIFSRRISYYDANTQLAYFDEPLPFSYETTPPFGNQTWTLRESLPIERWTLNKQSYFKTTRAENILTGPLPGYVVVLPDEASSIDNYYRGKYIYVVSNPATTYSPPLPPQSYILPINDAFYPIYGLFYIRAYNGQTKEVSISQIKNKYNDLGNNIPTYLVLNNINSGSFEPSIGVSSIIDEGAGLYRLNYSADAYVPGLNIRSFAKADLYLDKGTYTINFRVRYDETLGFNPFPYFQVYNGSYYYIPTDSNSFITYLTTNFETFTFTISVDEYLTFEFISSLNDIGDVDFIYFEWDLLEVIKSDTINIVELENDNYSPLDYKGTLVSANDTVCYQMNVESITLPNKPLLTGSTIAFYPFIYVQIENFTAPSKSGPNTIISNNPPSTKAVFTIYIPQVNSPDIQDFVTLYGGGTQIVKFKPNDNLKFSVYLPDGTAFETLIPDTLSPYPPDPLLQIHAIFSLVRL